MAMMGQGSPQANRPEPGLEIVWPVSENVLKNPAPNTTWALTATQKLKIKAPYFEF